MELVWRQPVASSRRVWIGGRSVEARRLALDFHEAAFVLCVRIEEVRRLVRRGELRLGSIDDDRTIDVESLVPIVEALVRDRELDEMSLVFLREIVEGARRVPIAVVRARPRHTLRDVA